MGDENPYVIEVYSGLGAKKKEPDKKVATCVTWALDSENALLRVQQFYAPPQHSYVVFRAKKLGVANVSIADLSDLVEESRNFREDKRVA